MATIKGKGIVWDKANNRVLCKFKDGEYTTGEMAVITLLQACGYEVVEDGWETEQGNTEGQEVKAEQTYNELRQEAKAKGINTYKMTKADIVDALKTTDSAGSSV